MALDGRPAAAARESGATAPRVTRVTVDPATGVHRLELSVLIYNVAGLPWPIGRERRAALDAIPQELAALRRSTRSPDILLLQEAFTSKAERIAKRAGYPYRARGPRRSNRSKIATVLDPEFLRDRRPWKGEGIGKWLSSGLYVSSDYPIRDVIRSPFGSSTCAGYDCLANKGAVLAIIEIPGVPEPLQILNTHLNSRGASGVSRRRSLYAHNRQIDEIAVLLRRHQRADWPFIYGGDFNTKGSSERYAHQVQSIPGKVVRAYCAIEAADCEGDFTWGRYAPWLSVQDLQGFASGESVRVRPLRMETWFDEPHQGRRLSDHVAHLVTYELSWTAPAGAESRPRDSSLRSGATPPAR
jgi:endonuclease/exonuclease/phosphatase family metal-dependent hydrolase